MKHSTRVRRDRERRAKLRARLEAEGVASQTIEAILAKEREDDRLRRLGVEPGPSREEILANTDDSLWPDDRGYRPSAPDPLLHGAGRVNGIAAKVVRRRETVTRWQYDRMAKGDEGLSEDSMSLREACKHGRWDQHDVESEDELFAKAEPCPGGRILSNGEVLRRLLYDVCETCGGAGEGDMRDRSQRPVDCPACGGSGRTPKNGVLRFAGNLGTDGVLVVTDEPIVVIPASMLEGESDE